MKILGYRYKLELADTEYIMAAGRTHLTKQKIMIETGMHEQAMVSTVLHEILEALSFHLRLKMDDDVIMPLEAGLYQVLTDAGIDLSPLVKELNDGNTRNE